MSGLPLSLVRGWVVGEIPQELGASLRDRASRPTAQAPTGLGDTATIPSAVERIAAGLFLAEHPGAEWNGGRARSIWFTRAYAALRAMRDPTDAMLAGACDKHNPGRPMVETTPLPFQRGDNRECPRFITRRNIWRKMVDAALDWPTKDDVAQAIEARRAETHSGSVHESAVAESHAPNPASNLQTGEGND
jgi:hypothetical protein